MFGNHIYETQVFSTLLYEMIFQFYFEKNYRIHDSTLYSELPVQISTCVYISDDAALL